MKESIVRPYKAPILSSTLNDEVTCRANGLVPTLVTYLNGVAQLNGASGYLTWSKQFRTIGSVRLKFSSLTPAINAYLFDLRTSGGTGYAYFSGATTLTSSSGTNYVDGVASSVVSATTKEIVITGITLLSLVSILISKLNSGASGYLTADIDLIEIYDYTLTANNVKNLYEGKSNKALSPRTTAPLILSVDAY